MAARRLLTQHSAISTSPDRSLEAHPQQLLRLDGELHRQLLEDFLAEAVHDHVDRILFRDAALLAVEELVLADLRGRRLVLDLRRRVLDLEIREGVGAAIAADQQRVALRVVARAAAVSTRYAARGGSTQFLYNSRQ